MGRDQADGLREQGGRRRGSRAGGVPRRHRRPAGLLPGDGRRRPRHERAARGATGTAERHVREWLAAQAASGYVTYLGDGRYELPDEHAVPLTQETSPAFVTGAFEIALGSVQATDRITEAMRTGQGLGWGEQDPHVHLGCERFFSPSYVNFLTTSWIPAMDGIADRLATGIRVADVGCGHGASTILLAQAYPESHVTGIDPHGPSIDAARKHAANAGVTDNVTFQRATAKELTGSYGLIAFFDCLHDLGDPVGALRAAREHLDDDGTVLVVEPNAADGRGEPQPRRCRLLRLLHPALHAQLPGTGGGRRAGYPGGTGPAHRGRAAAGFPRSGGSPRRRSTSFSRPRRRPPRETTVTFRQIIESYEPHRRLQRLLRRLDHGVGLAPPRAVLQADRDAETLICSPSSSPPTSWRWENPPAAPGSSRASSALDLRGRHDLPEPGRRPRGTTLAPTLPDTWGQLLGRT